MASDSIHPGRAMGGRLIAPAMMIGVDQKAMVAVPEWIEWGRTSRMPVVTAKVRKAGGWIVRPARTCRRRRRLILILTPCMFID